MILKPELTEQDARTLLGLIDLAVKAGGLQVAADAVRLSSIIGQAGERAQAEAKAQPQPKPEALDADH